MPIQIEMSFGVLILLIGLFGLAVSYTLYTALCNKELRKQLENYKQAVVSKDALIRDLKTKELP